MNKKQTLKILIIILALLSIIGVCYLYKSNAESEIFIKMVVNTDNSMNDIYQIYYLTQDDSEDSFFCEEKSEKADVLSGKENTLVFALPANVTHVRFDAGNTSANVNIRDFQVKYSVWDITPADDSLNEIILKNGINDICFVDGAVQVVSTSDDPYWVWETEQWELGNKIQMINQRKDWIFKGLICLGIIGLLIFFLKNFKTLVEFPAEVYHSKRLIIQLSKNDFKTKYAGSYLGIIWAFMQPIVTVLVYWFVFGVGLKPTSVSDVPFVLWLIAGMIPWFFFSDALNGGTNSLIEYNYLVKKIVFQIDILPVVKIISAMFVHVFFILFMLVLYAAYGYYPDLYVLQVLYYSFCLVVFVLGLAYATSAIVCFFRDLSQIIGIVLQIGIWMTPIMWDIEGMNLPEWLKFILRLNPLYYITAGYRDALINKVWFWERIELTLYFWIITLAVLGLGMLIFRKLKVHFADVL